MEDEPLGSDQERVKDRVRHAVVERAAGLQLAHRNHFGDAALVVEQHQIDAALEHAHRLGLVQMLVRPDVGAARVHDEHLVQRIGGVTVRAQARAPARRLPGRTREIGQVRLRDPRHAIARRRTLPRRSVWLA